jgi:hypothetical protein
MNYIPTDKPSTSGAAAVESRSIDGELSEPRIRYTLYCGRQVNVQTTNERGPVSTPGTPDPPRQRWSLCQPTLALPRTSSTTIRFCAAAPFHLERQTLLSVVWRRGGGRTSVRCRRADGGVIKHKRPGLARPGRRQRPRPFRGTSPSTIPESG